jgi:sialidase-1
MSTTINLLLCSFLIIAIACQEKAELPLLEGAEIVKAQVPVIRGDFTEVAILNVPQGTQLEGLRLAIKGEVDVEAVQILNEKGEVVGESKNGGKKMDMSLAATASGTLKVLIQVGNESDLRNRFDLEISQVEFEGEPYKVSQKDHQYRLAEAIRDGGADGIAAFRIPGLVTSKEGTLLAVYDIRRNSSVDLQEDIDVGLSRSLDGGQSWEPMQVIMDMGEWGGLPKDENGIGDPTILVDDITGTIWVVALWFHGKPGKRAWVASEQGMSPEKTGQLMAVKSTDDGKTWSEPINLTPQLKVESWFLFFNGPGRGISMKDGTLVFPAQFKDQEQVPHSTIIYSKDRGETWQVGTAAWPKTSESQVVELEDGSLMLNMRDESRSKNRAIMLTKDLGETWEEHPLHREGLEEPVCMASIIENPYGQKGELLFSNPASTEERKNITIKGSLDDGLSWPEEYQVLLDEGTGWGYSCMTMIDEDHIGILYESSKAHMTFQVVERGEVFK